MFSEKTTKNHFCRGEANVTSEARSFLDFFTVFLAIASNQIMAIFNFDFVQYNSDSQSFIIGFFAIRLLWTKSIFKR